MFPNVQPCFQLLRIGAPASGHGVRDLYTFVPGGERCSADLGRAEGRVHVCLRSASRPALLSRLHASLTAERCGNGRGGGGGAGSRRYRVYITDHSSSGTSVNERRVERGDRVELHDGDTVLLGPAQTNARGADSEFLFLFQKVDVRPDDFDAIPMSSCPPRRRHSAPATPPATTTPAPTTPVTPTPAPPPRALILTSIGSISKLQASSLTYHPGRGTNGGAAAAATPTDPVGHADAAGTEQQQQQQRRQRPASESDPLLAPTRKRQRKPVHTVRRDLDTEVTASRPHRDLRCPEVTVTRRLLSDGLSRSSPSSSPSPPPSPRSRSSSDDDDDDVDDGDGASGNDEEEEEEVVKEEETMEGRGWERRLMESRTAGFGGAAGRPQGGRGAHRGSGGARRNAGSCQRTTGTGRPRGRPRKNSSPLAAAAPSPASLARTPSSYSKTPASLVRIPKPLAQSPPVSLGWSPAFSSRTPPSLTAAAAAAAAAKSPAASKKTGAAARGPVGAAVKNAVKSTAKDAVASVRGAVWNAARGLAGGAAVEEEDEESDDEGAVAAVASVAAVGGGEACAARRCLRPQDETLDWVQCDACDAWFHMACVAYRPEHGDFHCGCS
ncbi:transcription factor 19 [Petromyzon marinus]|uniref:Transcription factor 19 n=1 Tax=Petromyzon marinus TaxID=7757 RepID=A0AAJ7UHU0_PETMA|nr:transcription factor 19 [Petromyzon marinus]